jgi:hypothetical protein
MEASAESADERRQQRMETGMASIVSVDAYEIGSIAAGPLRRPRASPRRAAGEHGEESVSA